MRDEITIIFAIF